MQLHYPVVLATFKFASAIQQPGQLVSIFHSKITKNELRKWPSWMFIWNNLKCDWCNKYAMMDRADIYLKIISDTLLLSRSKNMGSLEVG